MGESSKDFFASVHVLLFYAIAIMVIGHVLMLFHHKFAHGLHLLPRMLPGKTALGAVILVVIMAGLIAYTINKANTAKANAELDSAEQASSQPATSLQNPSAEQATTEAAINSASPEWQLLASDKNFQFSSSYSGEAFTGAIQSFTPRIYFTPQAPEQGVLDVSIDTASITTFNGEWDSTLTGSQWFATGDYPTARYVSDDIVAQGDGFVARGQLTLKGTTKPIDVTFDWQRQGDNALFIGSATIDRREFGIGSGSWASDDSIAFEVELDINLQLQPAQ